MAPARFPAGFVVALGVTLLLYAVATSSIADSRSSDAAGNAMSMGFAALFAIALWIAIAVLLLLGRLHGAMPGPALLALLVVGPAAVFAYFLALDRFGRGDRSALVLVFALPGLLMLYAVWARLAAWHRVLPARSTSAVLLGLAGALSVVAISGFVRAALPDPERDARLAAAAKVQEEQTAKEARDAREREAAEFAALGPGSSVADYLIYLHSSTYADRALEGIQKVKSRQTDAIALLEKRRLGDLTELWQFNVVPTREVCASYGTAFTAATSRIDRTHSDYISAAIELEWQLPNLKWLVTAKCDLSGPLERAETSIRAVADSTRLTNFAETLADIRKSAKP
jgi:hypothetical protein